LEIGEANWYGDEDPDFPCPETDNLFTIAKAFYADLFAPREIISVDANGTPAALRYDLNDHIPHSLFSGKFDISINHGTAEHVFNIAQVFVTMHQHTKCGGLMVHESPFTGWIDHGFYCLQPTLFCDLAAANNYEIVLAAVEHIESGTTIRLESRDHAVTLAGRGELPNNSMLFVVFRKITNAEFRIPMQGYYAKTLSKAGERAWGELR
jgi:hypothetical protein